MDRYRRLKWPMLPQEWLSFTCTSWELTWLSPKQFPWKKKMPFVLLLQSPYPSVYGEEAGKSPKDGPHSSTFTILHRLHHHFLIGGAITILKNDGVRQWEGWHPIYEMENKIHVWNHQAVFHSWSVSECIYPSILQQGRPYLLDRRRAFHHRCRGAAEGPGEAKKWCENHGICLRLSITHYQTWWFKMIYPLVN